MKYEVLDEVMIKKLNVKGTIVDKYVTNNINYYQVEYKANDDICVKEFNDDIRVKEFKEEELEKIK